MLDIQEFIQTASQKLGTTEENTTKATGGLMQLLQNQVGESDFSQLTDKIPGAAKMLSGGKSSGGGLGALSGGLGGLKDTASGMLGGKLGGAASVLAMFDKSGFDAGQASSFVTMFFNFAKEKAGGDLVNRLLDKVPDLKKLVG